MELGRDKVIAQIISRLETAEAHEGAVKVEGTWGSFAPMLAVFISKQLDRPVLYICPHIDDADKVSDDLTAFGGRGIDTFPAWEGAGYAGGIMSSAVDGIRAAEALLRLL